MKTKTSIKPGSLVHIPTGTFIQYGVDGYNSGRSYSVYVKEVTKGVSLSPRQIVESAYYSGVYSRKGGDVEALRRMQQDDPARYDRDQIELFEPRVVWQGQHKTMLETSISNVIELKM